MNRNLSVTQFKVSDLSNTPSGEFDGEPMHRVHGFFRDYYGSGSEDAKEQHAEQRALVDHVRDHGVLSPIILSRSEGAVVDGHHRYMAAVEAGLEHVPVRYR